MLALGRISESKTKSEANHILCGYESHSLRTIKNTILSTFLNQKDYYDFVFLKNVFFLLANKLSTSLSQARRTFPKARSPGVTMVSLIK